MLLAASCGGEERGPSETVERLAQLSDSVAADVEAGDACAARTEAETLQKEAIAAVNEGEVPEELQEDLLGIANSLLAEIGCNPAVALDTAAVDARRLAALLRAES